MLKQVSPALAAAVPTPEVLRDQVLAVPPDRWTTAYAKVAGSLPLDEVSAPTDSKVLYLQGELNVSAEGAIRIRPLSPVGSASGWTTSPHRPAPGNSPRPCRPAATP